MKRAKFLFEKMSNFFYPNLYGFNIQINYIFSENLFNSFKENISIIIDKVLRVSLFTDLNDLFYIKKIFKLDKDGNIDEFETMFLSIPPYSFFYRIKSKESLILNNIGKINKTSAYLKLIKFTQRKKLLPQIQKIGAFQINYICSLEELYRNPKLEK
jgi:hypothetical protein